MSNSNYSNGSFYCTLHFHKDELNSNLFTLLRNNCTDFRDKWDVLYGGANAGPFVFFFENIQLISLLEYSDRTGKHFSKDVLTRYKDKKKCLIDWILTLEYNI